MQIKASYIFKILSVTLLCSFLVLLTSINFFIYPPSCSSICYQQNDEQQIPTEEKSPSSLSAVQEEYLHHTNYILPVYYKKIATEYLISAAEQLPVVHFKLICPPPKTTI